MSNGDKLQGHKPSKAVKNELVRGQEIYELQRRMSIFEQLRLLLDFNAVSIEKMAKILEMTPQQKNDFVTSKMNAPVLVGLLDDKKYDKIYKEIHRRRFALTFADESKKDSTHTMIAILSKIKRFRKDVVITCVSVSFAEATRAYDAAKKLKKKPVVKDYHINDDQGFSEYDGTEFADFCFDLPEDIPKNVKTIEFKGNRYNLAKYRKIESEFPERDWLLPETTLEFVKLIKTKALIK